ncbi:MAG: 3-oxoacyl-ACP synthase III family protein [Planctomycetota bacterium]
MRLADAGIMLAGTGRFLPGPPLDNSALIARLGLDTTDAWIRAHIGVIQRHWAPPELATSDLATQAARAALQAAGLTGADLRHIVLGTSSGDFPTPATACLVQHALAARCPAHDVLAACAGFLYALDAGARLVATGLAPVLVLGADCKSRFLDLSDRLTCSIFGDGAGAAVLCQGGPGLRLIDSLLWADGAQARSIHVPAGGSRQPASAATVAAGLHGTRIADARGAFQEAVSLQAGLARTLLQRNELGPASIDWLISHQANRRIVEATAEALGVPRERAPMIVEHCGNTVAAGLPIALDELVRSGSLSAGQRLLLVSVGAGFTGGAALLEVPSAHPTTAQLPRPRRTTE